MHKVMITPDSRDIVLRWDGVLVGFVEASCIEFGESWGRVGPVR
jgi:hypothetical protein